MERRQIIVLGMHRSGTSAVTGLLHRCGAFVGAEEDLTGASSENPKGFFERRDARRIMDALLHSAEADWWKISDFEPSRIPPSVLATEAKSFRQLIGDLDEHGTWALKEPRLSLLLPVLKRFLNDPVVVFVARHPMEVAKSLRYRNGFSRTAGLALWEAYVVSALRASEDLPRLLVNYADVVADPVNTSERIRTDLAALGVVGLTKTGVDDAIDQRLHRQQVGDPLSEELLTANQARLWAALSRGELPVGEAVSLSTAARLVLEDFEIDRHAALEAAKLQVPASRLTESEEARKRLDAELKNSAADLRKVERRAEEARVEIKKLTGEVYSASIELAKREARLAERDRQLSRFDEYEKANRDLRLKAQEAKAAVEPVKARATVAEARSERLEGELKNARRQLVEQGHTLAEQRRRLAQLDDLDAENRALRREIADVRREARRVAQLEEEVGRSHIALLRKEVELQAKTSGSGNKPHAEGEDPQMPIRHGAAGHNAVSRVWSFLGGSRFRSRGKKKNIESDVNVVAESGLFDAAWYLRTYPDVAAAGTDPIRHYVEFGGFEGRDPSEMFRSAWYLEVYPDVRERGLNPLVHYVRHGRREGRAPAPQQGADSAEAPASPPDEASMLALLRTNSLFDVTWYFRQYPEVLQEGRGVDAAEHYIRRGWLEGRNPSPHFETNWYLTRYRDVASSGINPLVHYILYGQREGRLPRRPESSPLPPGKAKGGVGRSGQTGGGRTSTVSIAAARGPTSQLNSSAAASPGDDGQLPLPSAGGRNGRNAASSPATTTSGKADLGPAVPHSLDVLAAIDRMSRGQPHPVVIVPIHNAPWEVEACLSSVLRHSPAECRIIAIDDASSDRRVPEVLSRFGDTRIEIYRNETNRGFSATVNRGIELAGRADVVLLNADTVVTPGWLRNLRLAAYSGDRIGTATPFSNSAGAFSAPDVDAINEVPLSDLDGYGRLVTRSSWRLYPETPTGNGFCMYIRRDCLDETGLLDADAFPRGYGEENDFCMRAGRLGWTHVVDDATFIHHAGAASFGDAKAGLVQQGREIIDARYPEYGAKVRAFLRSERLASARERVRVAVAEAAGTRSVRPRVLFVVSTKTGGTPQTNQDLMIALTGRIDTFVLRCDSKAVSLSRFDGEQYAEIESHELTEPLRAYPHRSREYDRIVAEWLVEHVIEMVHVRHIAWHGLGLVDVASAIGLKVIFSFHDFYTICPNVKLLDERNEFCAGQCTPTEGDCRHELWRHAEFPRLKNAAITQWQRQMANVLQKCDAFVTTTEGARSLLCERYPVLATRPFHVIPHGRDFSAFERLESDFDPEGRLRIVFPGNISTAKGGEIIAELGRRADEERLEIHVLGRTDPGLDLPPGVVVHGAYERDQFAEKILHIAPHVGGVLSIWPETYCHTLTELWAAGVPAIGFNLGAVGERIQRTGCGWLADEATADAVIGVIAALRRDPARWRAGVEAVQRWQQTQGSEENCERMARRYDALYRDLGLAIDDSPAGAADRIALRGRIAVDVVVPVHNALDDVKRCLESLRLYNDGYMLRCLVVNDGSNDETLQWMRDFCSDNDGFGLVDLGKNYGYTHAVNAGLERSSAPFVITLNSDTIVTPNWLHGMIECAESDPAIGIVGPLSNAASWQNVPDLLDENGAFAVNQLPPGVTPEAMAEIVESASARLYARTPFVNGFCFLIKRAVLDAIGLMDEARFPVGYGEENDFCIRAMDAGFKLAVADASYVFHAKSKSFGHERRKELSAAGMKNLREKHGNEKVDRLIKAVRGLSSLNVVRENVKRHLEFRLSTDLDLASGARIVFLLPVRGGGGGVHSVIQEANEMARLGCHVKVAIKTIHRDQYMDLYSDIPGISDLLICVDEGDIYGALETFDIVVATHFSSAVVVRELYERDKRILPAYYVQDYEPLFFKEGDPDWEAARRSYGLLSDGVLFAKTRWIAEKVREEHGISVAKVEPSIDHSIYHPGPDRAGDKVVIAAMIRPSTPRRGADRTMRVLSRVAAALPHRAVVEIFGCKDDDRAFLALERDFPFVNHGVLKRREVAALLRRADVFVDLSDYQAFGRTALEAMACGCAAIVPVHGGTDEYALHKSNSLVVDPFDEDQAFSALSELVSDSEFLRKIQKAGLETAARYSIRSAAMSELSILTKSLDRHRQQHFGRVKPSCLILPALEKGGREPTNCAWTRVLYPYRYSEVAREWRTRASTSRQLPRPGEADVVLIQNDVGGGSLRECRAWLEAWRSHGGKIVYDIDDDYLAPRSDDHQLGAGALIRADRARLWAAHADIVTVATPALADRVRPLNSNLEIVPTYLDAKLWRLEGPRDHVGGQFGRLSGGPTRIGYFSTSARWDDADVVAEAMREIERLYTGRVQIEAIDSLGERVTTFGRRVGLSRRRTYPELVSWLQQRVHWDIGLAPVREGEEAKLRGNVQFLEYAALDMAIVCSDAYCFGDIARDGFNSLVVENTTASWVNAVSRLIDDVEYRQTLARNAREAVIEQYQMNKNVNRYLAILRKLETSTPKVLVDA